MNFGAKLGAVWEFERKRRRMRRTNTCFHLFSFRICSLCRVGWLTPLPMATSSQQQISECFVYSAFALSSIWWHKPHTIMAPHLPMTRTSKGIAVDPDPKKIRKDGDHTTSRRSQSLDRICDGTNSVDSRNERRNRRQLMHLVSWIDRMIWAECRIMQIAIVEKQNKNIEIRLLRKTIKLRSW